MAKLAIYYIVGEIMVSYVVVLGSVGYMCERASVLTFLEPG